MIPRLWYHVTMEDASVLRILAANGTEAEARACGKYFDDNGVMAVAITVDLAEGYDIA